MNKKEVRARLINNEELQEHEWAKDTPYDIRDEAMNDMLKALQATRAKEDLKQFDFKFRSKKDETQSITVLKKHWGHASGVYAHVFNSRALYGPQTLPAKLECDSRLIRTRLGDYSLRLPTALEIQGENKAPPSRVEAFKYWFGSWCSHLHDWL